MAAELKKPVDDMELKVAKVGLNSHRLRTEVKYKKRSMKSQMKLEMTKGDVKFL